MGLFDVLSRRPPIRACGELAEFIDGNAAFITQKGLFEYARARAGHYAKVLFSEAAFQDAVERSRWRAFPLGLAMVGEMAAGVLWPQRAAGTPREHEALRALVLSVFDRYPIPAVLGEAGWREERTLLGSRLQGIGLHPPKRSFEIADPFARAYFDLMPIHEKLRARDFSTMHNYLKLTLCHMHIELTKRIDAALVIRSLPAGHISEAPAPSGIRGGLPT